MAKNKSNNYNNKQLIKIIWITAEISVILLGLSVLGYVDLSQSIDFGFVSITTFEDLIAYVGIITGGISLADKI